MARNGALVPGQPRGNGYKFAVVGGRSGLGSQIPPTTFDDYNRPKTGERVIQTLFPQCLLHRVDPRRYLHRRCDRSAQPTVLLWSKRCRNARTGPTERLVLRMGGVCQRCFAHPIVADAAALHEPEFL